jgi:hypothetical protein
MPSSTGIRTSTTLSGARLYLLDDNGRIKAEQVIFCVTPD